MTPLRSGPLALAVLLLGSALAAAQSEDAGAVPARCSSYSVGSDTHTDCQPSGASPTAPKLGCTTSQTGQDVHVDCAPMAGPLGVSTSPTARKAALPVAPAPPIRCHSYAIGASVYTDCR